MTQTPENQQQYGSILTILGENAEQNGKLQNKQITFTHMAIGDANDEYVQPNRKQTALVNELARIPVNSVDVLQPTPDSVPMLKVEAILPDDVNDLVIREFAAVATFDGNTYFHAVGNNARIYVPPPVNNGNVSTPVTLEMIFVITSADPIVEIDPNVVTASREWTNSEDLYRQQENTASRILFGRVDELVGQTIDGHTHVRIRESDQHRNQLLIMSPIPADGWVIESVDLTSYVVRFDGGQMCKLRGVSFDVDTRADMYGLRASVGSTIRTLTAFGTDHGGWTYDVVNNIPPNGLNKIDIGNGLTAVARLGGIVPAGAYGAKLDLVTDDYPALKALHDDSVTYSLDGKTALCNGTLPPRSHQTIYPFGGGVSKKTPGYLFQKKGYVDNFVIEVGGNWDGGGVADFCDQDGNIGWGNAWTNCSINGIGSNFVNIFRLSNARRSTIKGRWHGRKALIYSNKSAECDVQFANFVRSGDLAGSIGLQCINEGDGYPEGLVVNAGMFFQFEKNLDIQDIFELNFTSVEFAGGSGNYQENGAQIDIRANGGQFVRGVYFDSNCHYHGRGMQFGSGQDNAPHSYECVVNGYFRSQQPGTTISLERFTHDVHIQDGTIFRYDGSPGTRIAVVGKQQQQGITVGSIKCYGYDSYVQFKGAGENNLVNNIPNLSNITSGAPCFFEYAVNYSNVQGMNNIIRSERLVNGAYPANTNIKTVRVTLGEGEYLLRTRASVTVQVAGSFGLRIQPVTSAVAVAAGGSEWSSMYGSLDATEKSFEKTVVVSVLKGGEFDVILETRESLSVTTTGYHDYISVEKV